MSKYSERCGREPQSILWRSIDGVSVSASFAEENTDELWGEFLQTTQWGQFQQAASWAQFKAIEGWIPYRCIVRDADSIIGGFQILWRKSRFGRIGYVSKGPVVSQESEGLCVYLIDLLGVAAKATNLDAVLVQPPDWSLRFSGLLKRAKFQVNLVQEIIEATLLVNLNGGMEEVKRRFSKSAQMEIKQAKRRGVSVRYGSAAEIGLFFRMMAATCQRQQQSPNPSSERTMMALWQAFEPLGARLMFANCRGEDVAGQFCIPFGDRVTIWKKGWTGQHRDCHPNRLLNNEGLEWACDKGFEYWDFAALDQSIAENLLAGKPLTAAQTKSRHMFHLGFGGAPMLLPKAMIWIRNPLIRLGYKAFASLRHQ